MNALQSYSSDESDDENKRKKERSNDHGTNYDNVGMDISEESDSDSERDEPALNTFANSKKEPDSHHNEATEESHRGSDSDTKERNTNDFSEKHKLKEHSRDDQGRKDSRSRHSQDYRDSRSSRGSSHRDHRERDYHRSRDDDRRYDDRRSRRSRSRSRERRYTRSRSRSRSRDRDRRRRRSRSRSRDRDRRRPHEIRKEAQQRLAAFKAENPNFDQTELLKQGMQAQFAELQKQTGITLPSYYNPATMNPLKIAEQERKKRLLWGNKAKTESPIENTQLPQQLLQQPQMANNPHGRQLNLWANTKFCNDSDGKMAEKFKRLMGVKTPGEVQPCPSFPSTSSLPPSEDKPDIMKKQEALFSSMEKQYEMARLTTHTHKGFGLGFSSSQQPFVPKQ